MLRDPYVIKRSDFWTKLKNLHAIEAVDIGKAIYPDCKQAIFKWIPYLLEGFGISVTSWNVLHVQGLWPWTLLAAHKTTYI